PGLIRADQALGPHLAPETTARSLKAGGLLLKTTHGARYQGLLGRYRQEQEAGGRPGHLFAGWAVVGHFFQLGLASLAAEYLRLEWELAARCLPGEKRELAPAELAPLVARLMQAPAARSGLFQTVPASHAGPEEKSCTGTGGSAANPL